MGVRRRTQAGESGVDFWYNKGEDEDTDNREIASIGGLDLIGKTISHYRIIDKIGQGGMGVVYKAEDTSLHRTVALKFLPQHLIGATEEMARFINEARAAASLSHPNICTIYEIDESAEQPFISMEYIEGKSLKDIMAGGPLELDAALRYALQIARGLEEAHTKGVVHRDIKSANVVVSDKGHAIVMDFGLAKLQGQTKLTRTGTTVGTVSYMSPEQARGDEADHRSDIWSLGVLVYCMVAGRYPFEGEHSSAVMYSIMNAPHEPLAALRTGVPLELERIVNKALAKDRDERYQSVSDMIVDLKVVRRALGGAKTSETAPVASKRRWSGRALAVAGATVAVAVVGFFAWRQLSGTGGSTSERVVTEDERVSIAVLPLANMSGAEDQEYVADGMTEALIAELAQIRALRVISRTSVMRFKNTTQSIREIAGALGVNTIIEGSIVRAGGRVRVTAQLIDAKNDEHLWAQSYERDMSDVLALQSEVASAIASEVKVKLTPSEAERLASSSAVDPRAYDLYLRGRYHWNRRKVPDLERALDLFQQAADIEPDWGLAYAAQAEAYLVLVNYSGRSPGEAYPQARDLARKGLALDPNLGSAWACLAGVESEWDWDWEKADEYYSKAIELEPNNASAHQWYAEFLTSQGRFDDALSEIDQARRIDPLSLIVACEEAWIHIVIQDYPGAIARCDRVIELDPGFTAVYYYLGQACQLAGQYDRAADAYARLYARIPGAEESIRKAYVRGGMKAVIGAIIQGHRVASATEYVSPAMVGLYFLDMGEADSAMVWLDRAYEKRAYPLNTVAVLPQCELIGNDPRFIDLLKRLKLDDVQPAYARK